MIFTIKNKITNFVKKVDLFVIRNRYFFIFLPLLFYLALTPILNRFDTKEKLPTFKKEVRNDTCDIPEAPDNISNPISYLGVDEIFENTYSVFPINVYSSFTFTAKDSLYLYNTLNYINNHFDSINFVFEIISIDHYDLPYIEDLKVDGYSEYYRFSAFMDLDDTLSLWVVENDSSKLCDEIGGVISCSRQNGWANIASSVTNNIVISRFDLKNPYICCHEFGHYFGLEHTFTTKYGIELPDGSNCETAGDRICDTPADPNASDIFVSYAECELFYGDYKPMINNMMAYYKPCVSTPYAFTTQQYLRMLFVGRSVHLHNSQPYK